MPPGVAHPRVVEPCRKKITPENSLVVNALPRLVWTALPDGHVDFLTNRECEYTGFGVAEACGCGRGMKNL